MEDDETVHSQSYGSPDSPPEEPCEPEEPQCPPTDAKRGTLYVLMHGLICLVDVGKLGFLAYVIDVGEDHKYLLGEWLVEKELPKVEEAYQNRLQLVGVTPGCATFDENFHAILRMTQAPTGEEVPIRAIITLPRPKEIDYGVQGTLEATALQGNMSKFVAPPTHVSGLTIFVYDFVDFSQVGIVRESGSTFVECPEPAGKDDEPKVSVLHIYNEPTEVQPSQHNLDEFNQSLTLLGATDIRMVNASVATEPDDGDEQGLLFGESATLDQRAEQVSILIRSLRRGIIPDSGDVGGGAGGPVCGGAQGTVI
jgi:hypothetical protein